MHVFNVLVPSVISVFITSVLSPPLYLPFLPQSGMNVKVILELARTISSQLCGVSTQQLEEAIGLLNRIKPAPLVRTNGLRNTTADVVLPCVFVLLCSPEE